MLQVPRSVFFKYTFKLHTYICRHMCMCKYDILYVCVCTCVHMCSQEVHCVFLYCSLPFYLKQGLSLKLKPPIMAVLVIEPWASDRLCPVSTGIVSSSIKLGFCVGVVNSGPHACEMSESPPDPSPQPQYLQFNPHSNAGKEKGDLVMPPPRLLRDASSFK